MATTKISYPANNQAITCTLNPSGAGIASSATVGRCALAVDNTANLDLDHLMFLKGIKTAAGSLGSDKTVYLYVAGTADGGASYTDGAPGTDSSFTRSDPPILRFLAACQIPAAATAYNFGPFSVASAFGGILPEKYCPVVVNFTGLALDNSAPGSLFYSRVQVTTT